MGFAPGWDASAMDGIGAGKTVLCHGCFDLLHLGHLRHLEEAAALGDRLVVSITADDHVNKGHGRPHFHAEQRREALRKLSFVDEVIISDGPTAVETIRRVRPAFYVKGVDYAEKADDPGLSAEREAVEGVGGQLIITTSEKWSSTKLLRSVKLSGQALAYIEHARAQGYLDRILDAFERADKLSVLFVGETIMDEYRYEKPLGKSSKEFIVVTVAAGHELFDGGILAAAKHGGWQNHRIATSVSTITKTRYVDVDFNRKLSESYSSRDIEPMDDHQRDQLKQLVGEADVVVTIDFGHGMIGVAEREILQGAKWLAVTAQTNAGNYGFNPVTKYQHADYVCVDEQEARLAAGHQGGTVDQAMFRIMQKMRPDAMTVTRGRYGSVSRAANANATFEVPAFIEAGFDTMGAGDAFLAVAGPLVAAGLNVEVAAFVGNVAGGLKTAILGHRRHVGRDDIIKNLEWLLK